jgi:fumarate hydratase subunit beta
MTTALTAPLSAAIVSDLRAGEAVSISGTIYTARDAAHARLVNLLARGEALPFDLEGAVLYYAGPTPARPGRPIGSCGPTTSERMDRYAPTLIAHGLRGMIGKGERSPEVIAAMRTHGAVYFAAIGGAGALLARCVTAAEPVAFTDLGTEAIRRLTVVDFPAIVAIDAQGNDYYAIGQAAWRR